MKSMIMEWLKIWIWSQLLTLSKAFETKEDLKIDSTKLKLAKNIWIHP